MDVLNCDRFSNVPSSQTYKQTNPVVFSPQANYTERPPLVDET
jgi:hypothetical protein